MSTSALKRGDLVEVRSPAEILATLDEQGMFEQVPFMPEMARYCGGRFAVERRTEKICDTIIYGMGSLRLKDTVLLGDLRCDGSGHNGCQAECRLFWKEVWLRKVMPDAPSILPDANSTQALMARISKDLTRRTEIKGELKEVWRCQSTELLRCTERLRTFDPRPYIREYTCGNVPLGHFLRVSSRAAIEESGRKANLIKGVPLAGTHAQSPPREPPLNLQPGDLVQVKTEEEIARTLTTKGYNRGLWFDEEMKSYCGGIYRVRQRVSQFIDERDGVMVEMKDAITLDTVTCTGDRSLHRWFCPRAIYPYWRECWLKRVEPDVAGGTA